MSLSLDEKLEIRADPWLWFNVYAYLYDRDKKLRQADPAGDIQQQVFNIYRWCMEHEVPCSIIGLKSRKEGLSTSAVAVAYHHQRNHPSNAVLIGNEYGTTDTLAGMYATFAANDKFEWGSTFTEKRTEGKGFISIGSEFKKDTAVDSKTGRSSTIQVVIATEVAHWPHSGQRSGDETMLSLLNSMPETNRLVKIVDSTAFGVSGWFYETYQGAVTFEEFKRGRRGNGWIKVFEPWWRSPIRVRAVTPEEAVQIVESLTKREQRGQSLYNWTLEQVAWRRDTIAGKCNGSEAKFDQEYPESELVAFRATGNPKFDLDGLTKLELRARSVQPLYAKLERQGPETVGFRYTTVDDHDVQIWEEPKPGQRYLVSVDTSTGAEQQQGSDDPDRHSVLVMREGYMEGTIQYDPMEVARIRPPNYWDIDVLADYVDRLSRHYGKCNVIVEVNSSGLALVVALKKLGTPLFAREKFLDDKGKSDKKPGWLTNEMTKEMIISRLAAVIRDGNIDIRDPHVVAELMTYVTNKNGKMSAQSGKHDDDVMALAIGLFNISAGTIYQLPENPYGRRVTRREESPFDALPDYG